MYKSNIPISILIFCMLMSWVTVNAFSNENLNYVINYKWGMIHKETGTACVSLRNQGSLYSIMLTARTKPWADKIFMVRDTLRATVLKDGLRPIHYEKISHEGGKYGKDVIDFSYIGNNVKGSGLKYREKKGNVTSSPISLLTQGMAYDMLSVFYYLRSIDFDKLKTNEIRKVSIFSGSKVETLSIRNYGKETIKLDGTSYDTYHIKFRFTSSGGKKSSDDMDTWITTDNRRIPVRLEASLPIGKIRCFYKP